MGKYIDGFVFPISRDSIGEYSRVAEQVANIYKEHGAIEYLEFVGDDMIRQGTLPFTDLVTVNEDETIVFGWIVFDSREKRDLVNKKVESDPRMPNLVAPLIQSAAPIFDPQRMAYGGFRKLLGSNDSNER